MRSGLTLHNVTFAVGLNASHNGRPHILPSYYNIFFYKNQISIFIWGQNIKPHAFLACSPAIDRLIPNKLYPRVK